MSHAWDKQILPQECGHNKYAVHSYEPLYICSSDWLAVRMFYVCIHPQWCSTNHVSSSELHQKKKIFNILKKFTMVIIVLTMFLVQNYTRRKKLLIQQRSSSTLLAISRIICKLSNCTKCGMKLCLLPIRRGINQSMRWHLGIIRNLQTTFNQSPRI